MRSAFWVHAIKEAPYQQFSMLSATQRFYKVLAESVPILATST